MLLSSTCTAAAPSLLKVWFIQSLFECSYFRSNRALAPKAKPTYILSSSPQLYYYVSGYLCILWNTKDVNYVTGCHSPTFLLASINGEHYRKHYACYRRNTGNGEAHLQKSKIGIFLYIIIKWFWILNWRWIKWMCCRLNGGWDR